MFIYFWQGERHSMNAGGAERQRERESEAGSTLWAVRTEPDTGLKLTDCEIMTWGEVGRSTDWATQAPQEENIFIMKNQAHSQNSKLQMQSVI